LDARELSQLAARLADQKKGERIRVLDVRGETNVADFYVIVTGLSRPHVRALYEELHVRLKAMGCGAERSEGLDLGWWVLMDYGDVVVHLMQPEAREYYDLEGLLSQAPSVDWSAADSSAAAQ
jgi:ribosome-associated protein